MKKINMLMLNIDNILILLDNNIPKNCKIFKIFAL